MSVDTARLQEFCAYGLMLVSGTFQVTLAFISLYDLLGWSAFVGVAIMVRSVLLDLTTADQGTSDLVNAIEHTHRSHSEESPAETDEVEGQEDKDDV